MRSKKTQKSLAKRLIESTGISFVALLVLAVSAYAFTTWLPNNPPAANPGDGNVNLIWQSNAAGNIAYYSFGDVGIGTTSPTAVLQIKAGTASAGTAPIKLTAGTLLGSPESGAIEFDGSNLYFTDSNPYRRTFATLSHKLSAFYPTSSTELTSVITDETGTGSLVFSNSPVFTTPNIGNATGSISGNAGTATALAANGANCAAGSFPLGVNAQGAVESCTSVNSIEIDPVFTAALDTNSGLAANSDSKVPSQKAVKTYVDGIVVGLLDDRGSYNASSNQFPSTGGSGSAGAIMKGDIWYISAPGTLGGTPVLAGYSVRALVDNPGQTAGNWNILNVGLGYVPENVINKVTSISAASTDTQYPTAKLLFDQLGLKAAKGANADITSMTALTSISPTGNLVFNPSGLVGIGTTAPTEKLEIAGGSVKTSNQFISTLADGTSPFLVNSKTLVSNLNADYLDGQHGDYYAPLANITGTQNFVAKFTGVNAVGNSVVYDDGNKIGIGTTTPLSKLSIQTAGDTYGISMGEAGSSTGKKLILGYLLDAGYARIDAYDFGASAYKDLFLNGGAISLKGNGNVGIGTTSPTTKLEVVGGPVKTTDGLIIQTYYGTPSNLQTGQLWLDTSVIVGIN
ncbi:MAG: hypothetical protein V1936_02590 [Patescibacteria group bacterium]